MKELEEALRKSFWASEQKRQREIEELVKRLKSKEN